MERKVTHPGYDPTSHDPWNTVVRLAPSLRDASERENGVRSVVLNPECYQIFLRYMMDLSDWSLYEPTVDKKYIQQGWFGTIPAGVHGGPIMVHVSRAADKLWY